MSNLVCKICGTTYVFDANKPEKSYLSFIAHLRNVHALNRKRYVELGHVIDADAERMYKESISSKNKDKIRNQDAVKIANDKLLSKIGQDEFDRYPKCAICGFVGKQLFKHISHIHNITMPEYTSAYPNSSLALPEYYEYLSETRLGESNPMFNNGSTTNTPFHVDFYTSRGYSVDDAERMANDKKVESKSSMTPDKQATRPEYYMRKFGVDYGTALQMASDRQKTNTVDAIAKRNNISIDDAQIIRDQITEKWCTTIASKSEAELIEINRKKMNHKSISKISLKFIDAVIKSTNIQPTDFLFGESELTILTPSSMSKFKHKCFMYDLCYKTKIIEFNGNDVHANPEMFTATDTPIHKFNSKSFLTAQQIWDYDAEKKRVANSHGYEVMVVWESEWKKDKAGVLNRVKEFLCRDK